MAKTCPYHGNQLPCRVCLVERKGEFNTYQPRPGECPYHGQPNPCLECFDKGTGEFANKYPITRPYVLPSHRPVHFRQQSKDTCAVACCGMLAAALHPGKFTQANLAALKGFMDKGGIYLSGQGKTLFHALDRPLKHLQLQCELHNGLSIDQIVEVLYGGSTVILEALQHVLVIFSVNADKTLVVGDPAMSKVEVGVLQTDYRLKGTGRIWEVWT